MMKGNFDCVSGIITKVYLPRRGIYKHVQVPQTRKRVNQIYSRNVNH